MTEWIHANAPNGAGTVILTLVPSPNYDVGLTSAATVSLDRAATLPGMTGAGPSGESSFPVRYWDGMVIYQADDLESDGFAQSWGYSRSWFNLGLYTTNSYNGNGWVNSSQPYLSKNPRTGSIGVVDNGDQALFFDLVSGNYVPESFTTDQLTYDSSASEFVLTRMDGNTYRFWDFSSSLPTIQQGQMKEAIDPYGTTTQVTTWTTAGAPGEIQRSATVGGSTLTESYLYSYISGGANDGLLSNITLRRKVGSGSWSTVREVEYTYYDGIEAHGNARDLKTAVTVDASSNVLNTEYYRYYTGEAGGFTGGLKYAFRGDSYALLAAAYSTPSSATDAQVAPFADHFFQYDTSDRATEEVAKGAGNGNGGTLRGPRYVHLLVHDRNIDFNRKRLGVKDRRNAP